MAEDFTDEWDKYKAATPAKQPSGDEWDKYVVSKKASGSGGAPTSLPSTTGGTADQSSQAPTDNTPGLRKPDIKPTVKTDISPLNLRSGTWDAPPPKGKVVKTKPRLLTKEEEGTYDKGVPIKDFETTGTERKANSWENLGNFVPNTVMGALQKDAGKAAEFLSSKLTPNQVVIKDGNVVSSHNPYQENNGLLLQLAHNLESAGAEKLQKAQQYQLPETTGGNLTSQITGFVPDLIELAAAPELKIAEIGKLGDVLTKLGGKYAPKAANMLAGKFPLLMGTKGLTSGYVDAKHAGATDEEANTAGVKKMGEQYASGLLMEGAGAAATKVTKIGVKALEDAGWMADGKILGTAQRAMMHSSAQAAMFSLVPFVDNSIQGKDTSLDEMKSSAIFGGLLGIFHAPKTEEPTIADHSAKAIAERSPLIDMHNFMQSDMSGIAQAHSLDASPADLEIIAATNAEKAYKEKDPEKKQEAIVQSGLNGKLASVKSVTEAILKDKNAVIEGINQLPLSDQDKQSIVDRVNEVHKQLDPTEQQKTELGKQIRAIDEQLSQMGEKSDDPIAQAENEVKQEQLEKQREELNNNLKQLIIKQNGQNENAEKSGQTQEGESGSQEEKGVPAKEEVTGTGGEQLPVINQKGDIEHAIEAGQQPESGVVEHQDGNKSGETAEASGSDSFKQSGEKQKEEKLTHQEAEAKHFKEQTDPNEIAARYHTEQDYANDKERAIIDYLGNSKINERDYNRWGDRKRLGDQTDAKRLRWIDSTNSDGTSLDVHAEILSHDLGYQVTPEDIIDVIDKYKGREHFNEENKSETQKLLEQQYEDLTGKKLTPKRAENAYINKLKLTNHERNEVDDLLNDFGLTTNDIENEQQERNPGSETTSPASTDEKSVQQPKNDGVGDAGKTGQGEAPQAKEAQKSKLIIKKPGKAGDPLRQFANKVREGKISKLTGFKASTLFDKAWDGSLEAVALAIDGGAKLTDAIEAGLKHIRETEWYKSLTDNKNFERQYKDHLTKEYDGNPAIPDESGLSKAAVSENRQIIGKEDIDKPEKIDTDEEYRKAAKKVDDGLLQPLEIAQRIIKDRETPTIEEFNALLYHNRQIDNRYEVAQKQVEEAEKSGNPNDINEARNALIALDKSKDLLHTAARNVSYNWGFMGRMLQEAVKKDYSLSNLRRLFRAKSEDGKIPEDIDKLITQYSKERDEALKKLQEYQAKEAENAAQKEVDRQNRQRGKVLQGAKLDKAINDSVANISKILKAQRGTMSMNPIPVEVLPEIAKLVGYYTQKGILKASEVAENIYNKLKDDIDGLTKRDVIDAIAGNGYEKDHKTLDQLTKDKAEIVRQAKLISRLEDIESGKIKPTILRSRAKLSAEVEKLREQIKKTAIDLGLPLKNHKDYLKNKLAELEQKIKEGDYSKKTKPQRVEPDHEVQQLRAKIKRAETRIDELGATLDERREHAVKKVLDGYTKVHRLFVLSRIGTLAKLTSAAAGRAITTPIEEIFGAINAILPGFRKIAERSPRYAKGLNISDEVKAIATHFTKRQWQQNLQVLKEGHSDMDYLFDPKAYKDDGDVYGFAGRMHAMLKNSTKTAEFVRSFSHILEWEKNNNPEIDINDEVTQERIGKESMKLAQRSIFMNDNMAVDIYKDIINIAERRWGNTGTAVATVMRALMPIVKIPTNFALEATDIATLGARSLPTIVKAVAKGAESLSPKEADFVMRLLRKGEMGLVFMTVAYLHPDAFGGYYIQGEKRDKKDLQTGDLKLFGAKIPHLLQHWPLISAMQAAATFRRTQDYYLSKGKEGGSRAGILNGFKGIYESVPFLELPGQITKAFESDNATDQFVGQVVKNQMVPGLIQEAAEQTDTKDKSFMTIDPDNVVKRKPDVKSGMVKAIKENVMSAIPGWREMIAEKPEEVDKSTPIIKMLNGDEYQLSEQQVKEREKINEDYLKQHGAGLTKRFTTEAKMSKSVKEKIKKLSSFWKQHDVSLEKQKEYKQLVIDDFVRKHLKEMAEKHSKPIMLRKYKKADGTYDFNKGE